MTTDSKVVPQYIASDGSRSSSISLSFLAQSDSGLSHLLRPQITPTSLPPIPFALAASHSGLPDSNTPIRRAGLVCGHDGAMLLLTTWYYVPFYQVRLRPSQKPAGAFAILGGIALVFTLPAPADIQD
jgi:hypothetical protein